MVNADCRVLAPLAVPFLYTPFQNKYGTATEVNISEVQDAEAIHIIYSNRNIKFNKYT